MKKLLPILALAGLALTIVPPLVHLFGNLPLKTTFHLMTAGMVVWFAAATPWLGKAESKPTDKEVQI
jgi:thiosulfate reductase cytochrome b subunit